MLGAEHAKGSLGYLKEAHDGEQVSAIRCLVNLDAPKWCNGKVLLSSSEIQELNWPCHLGGKDGILSLLSFTVAAPEAEGCCLVATQL